MKEWEVIIGLEIHVELNTISKLFSCARNRFGDEPNVNIDVVCTGQPGALPVLNREAVKKGVLFGLAIHAHINQHSAFDRKSYFYPDSPRNFQITQFEKPLVSGGFVEAYVDGELKRFDIDRAHLEDDAGMLKHFSSFAALDDNRAGVPLIEIVSLPCIHSAKEATAYATAIKEILEYTNVSDCNMEEGSMRMDVNISVRPKGEQHKRHKIEIKNMNSFANMELAIEAETKRQIEAYESNAGRDPSEVITPATFRFDPEKKETVMMRVKEHAEDYRYFPEPDLPPIILEKETIQKWAQELPELPKEKRLRYTQDLGLSQAAALLLTSSKPLADYFEKACLHCKNAEQLCNWITIEFAGRYKDSGQTLLTSGISAQNVAKLVGMIDKGIITGKIAKSVADEMVRSGKDCELIVRENPDFQPMQDTQALEEIVDEVLRQNPTSIADYRAGKTRAFDYLIGQIMKATRGRSDPATVNRLLKEKLAC